MRSSLSNVNCSEGKLQQCGQQDCIRGGAARHSSPHCWWPSYKLDRLVISHLTDLLFIFSVHMFAVGAIFGAVLASLIGHHYGRRLCLLMLAVPDLLGWLVMATSTKLRIPSAA